MEQRRRHAVAREFVRRHMTVVVDRTRLLERDAAWWRGEGGKLYPLVWIRQWIWWFFPKTTTFVTAWIAPPAMVMLLVHCFPYSDRLVVDRPVAVAAGTRAA